MLRHGALEAMIALAALAPACSDDAQTAPGGSTTTTTSSAGGGGGGGSGGAGGSAGATVGGGGGAVGPQVDCTSPSGGLPALALELVADGLTEPVAVKAAPGDDTRLYVVEKAGRIRIIENGALLPTPFLDLSAEVWAEDEAGMLGLAFHPDYADNGRFFVYYTILDPMGFGGHLAELRRSDGDPNLADPTPLDPPILTLLQSHVHQGGSVEISPVDGYLYLSTGERGTSTFAPDLSSPLGKILRLDVSTDPPTPAGNVPGGLPEIWDYGLRNPWRTSFDPCTGDFYIGDVGELVREEIDIEPPFEGHRNYGWPTMEGTVCHPLGSPCNPQLFTGPAIDHGHDAPDFMNAIIGGVVYRGSAIPALRGMYLYSDTTAQLRGLRRETGETVNLTEVMQGLGVVVALGSDPHGEVYIVEYMPAGRIHRLVPAR